ncbi:MAG: FtsX-like permease family protein [Elusimicrobiota bacterium]
MIFSLKMAWAYFKKIWSRGILGVMVIISVAGVALGVASLVVTLSVMNGFHTEITSKLLKLTPHLTVLNSSPRKLIDDEINSAGETIDQVEKYGAFVYGRGLLQRKQNSQGVVIKGVEAGKEEINLKSGTWGGSEGIAIGENLAKSLGLKIDDKVYLVIPRVEDLSMPVVPRIQEFTVNGIFKAGMYEYDTGLVYAGYSVVEELFEDTSNSKGVEIFIKDPFKAGQVSGQLKDAIGEHNIIRTWQDQNRNLFAALKLEKTMMFIVLVMIVVVATFNIAGSLIMVAVSRSKDCGILRAMGATKKQIMVMFNLKGIFIGLGGTAVGVGLGIVISLVVEKYQFIELPPEVYLVSRLPVQVSLGDIAIISVTAVLISFLSTIYPAYRAGHIQVAEELRYE